MDPPPPPIFLPQALLEAGADPHAVTLAGANALHFAHDVEGVRALLAVGVDVNTRTRAGLSPLHALLLRDASDRALVLAGVGDIADVAAAWYAVCFQLERGAKRKLCHYPAVPLSCGVFCRVHLAVAEFLRCVDIDFEAPFKGQTPAELARAQKTHSDPDCWGFFDVCVPGVVRVFPRLAELRDSASRTIAEAVSERVGGFLLLAGLAGRPPISLATDVPSHLYTLPCQWCRLPGRASNALVPVAEDLGGGRRSRVSASRHWHYCRYPLQATPGAGFRAAPQRTPNLNPTCQ